ncbi:hypothetical protein ABK040_008996 [Willaertia magna]
MSIQPNQFVMKTSNTDPNIGHLLQLKLHWAKNLPKADVIGTIDPYATISVPLKPHGNLKFTTPCFDNNPNPVWNFPVFCDEMDISRNVTIEIWDKDSFSKNDRVCTVEIPLNMLSTPIVKQEYTLTCLEKFKPLNSSMPSTICVSMGIALSFQSLVGRLKQIRSDVIVNQMKKTLYIPLFDRNVKSGYFNTYLKVSLLKQIKVSIVDCNEDNSTYQNIGHFEVSGELQYVPQSNMFQPLSVSAKPTKSTKIKVKKYTYPKHEMNFEIYNSYTLKKSIKVYKNLSFVTLILGNSKVVEKKLMNEITQLHGWTGTLGYEQAKKTLKNVICDDHSKSVYMIEKNYFVKNDWDSDNCDQKVGLLEPYRAEGLYIEILHEKKNHYTWDFLNVPKQLSNVYYGLTAEVSDLPYPVYHSDLKIKLFQRSNPSQFHLLDICPLL